jgi:hypothetical protein
VVGGLTEDRVRVLLQDNEEYIRAWTVQLALEDQHASEDLLRRLTDLAARDPSAVVRVYLTSALQRIPADQRWGLASALAMRAEDANDHNLPLLLWYGVEPLVLEDPPRAIELALTTKIPKLRRFLFRRAAAQNDTLPAVVSALGSAPDIELQQLIMEEMLASFEGRVGIPMPKAWETAYDVLAHSKEQAVRDRADQLAVLFGDQRVFGPMRALLADPGQETARRQQALDVLVKGQDTKSSDVLLSDAVLSNPDLQAAAVKALATLGSEKTPTVLLDRYRKFSSEARADAISTLVSRPTWTTRLLSSIGSGADAEQRPARLARAPDSVF